MGPLKDNKPHGIGHYKYANDNIYIGNYKLGEREGPGNLILNNGDVLYQEYVNGELINSSTSF